MEININAISDGLEACRCAARLVEVICRMDEEAEWYTPSSLEMARHQRDAARAEAARLRSPEWRRSND